MRHPKILIVNPFGIGDVIFSTPLVGILKDRYRDCYIGYICNKRAHEVVRNNPNLDRIFVYEKDDYRACWNNSKIDCIRRIGSFLRTIKKERFDILIDLSLGYQMSLLMKCIGIKRRLGFNYRHRGRFLTDRVDIDGFDGKHVIEHYLDVLKLLGISPRPDEAKPRIYLDPNDIGWAASFLTSSGVRNGDALLGVIPGCGASWGGDARYRQWGRENFAVLAGKLIERRKAKIMLMGDKREEGICRDVQAAIGHEVINNCGKTSAGQFMALLARCAVVITNDGGPLHIAAALGVRTVSIFGPVDDIVYGPYPNKGDHVVLCKKDLSCRPCYRRFKYYKCENRVCLDMIKPDDVLEAVERILAA